MEDWFQAKTTAESILEFVEDSAIRDEAKKRLVVIERMENDALQLNAPADTTHAEEIMPEAP